MIKRKCFVIMPFGDKLNIDVEFIDAVMFAANNGTVIDLELVAPIDFDTIYRNIITKAVAASKYGLTAIRCDEIPGAGSIHADMFQHIHDDDVVIVDISTLNANVFYELGVRHALKRNVTLLIKREGTVAPFNIAGFRVITYNENAKIEETIHEIADFMDEGLENTDRNDSPVHLHIPELDIRRRIKVISDTSRIEYEIKARPETRIGLITGDLQGIKDIDVWVNSENTNMQMARFHDRSISGVIRWLGAIKKRNGRIEMDAIAYELSQVMDGEGEVEAGTVLPTSSGELARSHGVKKIFHAAAAVGQISRGYRPITDISICVRRALELMDDVEFKEAGLETILFPLIGAGTAGAGVDDAVDMVIQTSLAYLDRTPNSRVKGIYIIARVQQHRDSGVAALNRIAGLRRMQ